MNNLTDEQIAISIARNASIISLEMLQIRDRCGTEYALEESVNLAVKIWELSFEKVSKKRKQYNDRRKNNPEDQRRE